jgi:cytochrome c biogenesis protein CcmG, thiol:disulfide interchange protein DsbE
MSRGLRTIPILLLIALVVGFAWRLVKPADPAVHSTMIERTVPPFELAAAAPGKPGLTSADLADGKPKLLNIFASWCVPCAGEAVVLGELRKKGVRIDAIAVRDTPDAVAAFLGRYGDPYDRMGSDPQSGVQMSLGSSGVPETFLVDGRGVIRRQYVGPLTAANIPSVLEQLEALR